MALFFRRWLTRPDTRSVEVVPLQGEAVGAQAQFLKGANFASGQGVTQDYVQAARCYAAAADQNHSAAQLELSMLYKRGEGVAKDAAKAVMWLTRAAKLGNAAAQYRLGVQEHLACREGPPRAAAECRIESLKWTRLAAAQGYRRAESACEYVALGMTREEVAESTRRVAAFLASLRLSTEGG